MKKQLFFIAAVLTIYIANAQQISEVKLKTNQFGLKKAKKGPKKVFIKSFNIYYEVYKEAVDYKNGYNGTRGKKVGSATARAAVGLDGVQSQDIQEKTNRLYQEFVNDFMSNGYEIITAEEASKVEFFEGWKKVTGPSINEAEKLPGVLSCVPEGFTALYKDRSKVAAKLNKVFKGLNTPVLSKQLDDALVIDVNVYIMFSEIASKGFNLGSLDKVAKVKINTNLRLANSYTVQSPKKPTKLGVLGSIGVKGAMTSENISSSVDVVYGKAKIAASAIGQYNGTIKKSIEINGVMKKEKIKAYQRQQTVVPTSFSNNYQQIGGVTLVTVEDRFSKNATWIKVDSKKYADGLYNASSAFLKANIKEILEKIN
ncbi:hypothetical protein [Wenyingzhuangia marina]|uniref:LPP20 lipoprotein n=1 Tax=Wenyingzhuangia marina TaxID=1195760 RepID=A0A1M5SEC6_9FLAO|nr:hypothetical protein [Wenyingzhuangia marina]GGF61814.1 hypothetical protein GCM10011397_01170 [Wenyingzhuangia marina]SHH36628.1 hypothetical protein SAMN05444281_0256 [Wenyingzhuangia marina]